jgi:hypothetical protein
MTTILSTRHRTGPDNDVGADADRTVVDGTVLDPGTAPAKDALALPVAVMPSVPAAAAVSPPLENTSATTPLTRRASRALRTHVALPTLTRGCHP